MSKVIMTSQDFINRAKAIASRKTFYKILVNCRANFFLTAPGVRPITFLKALVKYCTVLKPHWAAMAGMGVSVWESIFDAFSTRRRVK